MTLFYSISQELFMTLFS